MTLSEIKMNDEKKRSLRLITTRNYRFLKLENGNLPVNILINHMKQTAMTIFQNCIIIVPTILFLIRRPMTGTESLRLIKKNRE